MKTMNPDPELLRKLKLNPNDPILTEQIERDLLCCPPAPRLTGPVANVTTVAIPKIVTDTLAEAIKNGQVPLTEELIGFLEAEVAHYNNVPRATICADHLLRLQGKTWDHIPEVAAIATGFDFYPKP